VVGDGGSALGSEARRWTSGGGMVGLGDLPGGPFPSAADGVSADGSVVVGVSSGVNGISEAFRWTSGGGMVGLGQLEGGISFRRSRTRAVSGDGSVLVGVSTTNTFSEFEAFRWTSGDGMVGLGDLAFGIFRSNAFGVSADGSVVVGHGASGSGQEAFRWTSGGGMVGLGDLAGGSFESWAFGVSADGSVVVGHSRTALGLEAFIWDAVNGMQNLRVVLESQLGLDLTGWTLGNARGISADGQTIVGWGTNPDGFAEAFIAVIPRPGLCLADITGDGNVNVSDLLDLLAAWGSCPPPCPPDSNFNGTVNVTDLLALLGAWGACP
ncbi:MAG: hypothetical protein IIB54_14845, partial [Planctomycetes bacterium]|nr:hypothetical protein [Planctomycetota bacterium]